MRDVGGRTPDPLMFNLVQSKLVDVVKGVFVVPASFWSEAFKALAAQKVVHARLCLFGSVSLDNDEM